MGEMRWFRQYSDAVDNAKLKLLAFEDRWHYVAVCCLQCAGLLDDPDDPMLERKISVKLGVRLAELDEIKRRLFEVNLIAETWKPVGWDERQFASDVSTDRVRKHRNKKGKSGKKTKRFRNVAETVVSDSVSVSVSVSEGEREGECPDALDGPSWNRWFAYRKAIRKPIKPVSIPAAQRQLAGFGADQAAVVEQSIANGWQGLFAPKAASPASHETDDPYFANLRRSSANH